MGNHGNDVCITIETMDAARHGCNGRARCMPADHHLEPTLRSPPLLPPDAPPVSLIGDSTMAGMAWTSTTGNDPRDIVGNAYRLTFDAESCRRLVIGSCRGRFGYHPAERAAADANDAARAASAKRWS